MEQIFKIRNQCLYISKYDKKMNYKKLILSLCITFTLYSCADYRVDKSKKEEYVTYDGGHLFTLEMVN